MKIARDLRILRTLVRRTLEPGSDRVLDMAAAQAESSTPWRIEIPSEQSLLFRVSEADPRLQPDIICILMGSVSTDAEIMEQSVVLRVWSVEKALSFRPEWDCSKIEEKMRMRGPPHRIIFRCHFDKAEEGKSEPKYHLQFGGIPKEKEKEMCWFPTSINIPRIPHPPVDLVLATELVLANFFPTSFDRLKVDGRWKSLVRRAADRFLAPYYRNVADLLAVESSETVLCRLWNVPWKPP